MRVKHKQWIFRTVMSTGCYVMIAAAQQPDAPKSLIDYFLPMEPQGALVTEGIWGDANVLPRDPLNGLEDPTLEKSCYWDGKIVKGDDGRYHMYASRWDQSYSHSRGVKQKSKAIHAVSDHAMGPYKDMGLLWPDWQEGKGHHVTGLRMADGRYAVVTSSITTGEVFVAESPDGPFELLGQIKVDCNGFDPALARNEKSGHMDGVTIMLRPDGRYMLVSGSAAVMISEDGILGPYKMMHGPVYKDVPKLPQQKMGSPTVWYSGEMYHMVLHYWRSDTAYHLTSEDGIHDWKNRGIAYRHGADVFRYTDGTVNRWATVQRPTVYLENGHVTHFNFSVIDSTTGGDGPHDNNGSKIVVVPFDGETFDRDMQEKLLAEKAPAKTGK